MSFYIETIKTIIYIETIKIKRAAVSNTDCN